MAVVTPASSRPGPAGRWNVLNGRHFYTSQAWLLAFSELADMPAIRETRVAAAAVGHRAVTAQANPRYTHEWLYEDALRERVHEYGLLGGCAGYESHFPHVEDATPEDQRSTVEAVADKIGRAALLVAHVPTAEALHLVTHRILPGSAVPVLSMPVAELDLADFGSFDDYVDSLSRNNRSGVRRDLRRADASGLRTDIVPLRHVVDEVAPLLGQVQGHHGDNPDPAAAADYLRLCCHGGLAESATAFVSRNSDGDAVAFALGYPWHDTVFMRVAGMDYQRATVSGAYFASYFYAPIRHALATGRRLIDFGGESLESKLRRGSTLQPRWALSMGVAVDPAAARAVSRRRVAHLIERGRGCSHWSGSSIEQWPSIHDRLSTG
ncbi:MAG: hypothetical protein CSA84_07020 [Actinomycetales bacterium]|nr:MAG: hypothetical protein CSA84_07020 [Actinomycetales bacterium]